MNIFKYTFMMLLFFAIASSGQVITAQNADINAGVLPTVTSNTSDEDLRNMILTKISEVKGLLKQADESYNAGDYDKGYEYAVKAKALTEEINKLREELYNKVNALNKIEEAKKLIIQAEAEGAQKYAPDELAQAKTSLLSAENSYEQKGYTASLAFADEAYNFAQACLNRIAEKKKTEVENKLDQIKKNPEINPVQKILPGTGEFKIKTTYTVRYLPEKRDCLWRISAYDFVYNTPWKWPVIYKANKNKIRDPDLIFPGQVLDIPELDKEGNPVMLEKEKIQTKEIIEIQEK